MTNLLDAKIILYKVDGSESEWFMVVVDRKDVQAAMEAISQAKDIWNEQRYNSDIDLLEDQIAEVLEDRQIAFCLPYYRSVD